MAKLKKQKHTVGRPSKADDYVRLLKSLGLFCLDDAKKAGIPQQTLSRLVAEGSIIRLSQNLYRHPDAAIDPATEDFVIACAKFGDDSAIGGLTALFHYGLLEQVPQQIWIVVPPEKYSRDPFYRCMRTKKSHVVGVRDHDGYRMVTPERAIAEGFYYSTKIGLETMIRAARIAFKRKLTTPAKVLKIAKELGMEKTIFKNWEALTVP